MKRVLLPFLLLEIVTFLFALFFTDNTCSELVGLFIKNGGYGPGSYYPWIYLQIALLLPVFSMILKKFSKTSSLIVFLVLCEGLEILCSIVDFPDAVYRLLAIRYIFLLFLGYQWVKGGVVLNAKTIIFSIISLAAIIYFEYFYVDAEPWFYHTSWKCSRWPCYYFVAYGFTALLYQVWGWISRNDYCVKSIKMIAKSSYEIFLIQMSVIFLFKSNMLFFLHSTILQYALWVAIVWSVSIGGGIILNRFMYKKKSTDNLITTSNLTE